MHCPLTVADFLNRAENVYGDRIAVVDEPDPPGGSLGPFTYKQMASMARSLAVALDELGVGAGERVAILSPNAARFLVALYGVGAYGRVTVPINFRLKPDEIAYILEHSGAQVLLVDPEFAESVADIPVPHRFVLGKDTDAFLFLREDARPSLSVTDENATASINYTSGTTARPKGVELTQRNLWLNATTFGWHSGVSDRDTYLHVVPTFHCNGWGMPYGLAAFGVTQVILRKVDGAEILKRVAEHGVTLMCGAPAVFNAVVGAAASVRAAGATVPGHGRVRAVVAGAPPPAALIEKMEIELGWEFLQIWGLTETSPMLSINRGRREWDDLPVGERARNLSRAGAPVLGVTLSKAPDGEILARSNHVFAGYWEQSDKTAEALDGGWFHTGDGGHFEGAYLVVTDRKKDVIISGGENVSSIEVEDCLYQHPSVAEVAVIGVPDPKWGETVKALLVLRPGTEATEGELIAHCRERMAHYKCPTSIEFRDQLARTAIGKLQKFKLREPYWAGRDRMVN